MLHIPILRKGTPYRSVETETAVHYRTREPFVEYSRANTGLVQRDLNSQGEFLFPSSCLRSNPLPLTQGNVTGEALASRSLVGSWGVPDDVASVVLMLAAPEAGFLTVGRRVDGDPGGVD